MSISQAVYEAQIQRIADLQARLAEAEALLREARDREYLEWGCTAFVMRCDTYFENYV